VSGRNIEARLFTAGFDAGMMLCSSYGSWHMLNNNLLGVKTSSG